jgi:hypothetical protein
MALPLMSILILDILITSYPVALIIKQSLRFEKELGSKLSMDEAREKLKRNFEVVFTCSLEDD